jgi:hypothetical protein
MLVLNTHPSLKHVANSTESQNVSGKSTLSIRAPQYHPLSQKFRMLPKTSRAKLKGSNIAAYERG